MIEQVKEISKDFFDKLWVDYSNLEITEEAEKIFLIKIESTDSNILIGPHGKNIDTLKSLLKLLIGKKLEDYIIVHLEINDYMKLKEEKLLSYIKTKIQFVKDTGKEITLPFFTAYERKKVHSYVSENGGNVYTQSIGEWHNRKIHLCKKDAKLTIDIDGDDI